MQFMTRREAVASALVALGSSAVHLGALCQHATSHFVMVGLRKNTTFGQVRESFPPFGSKHPDYDLYVSEIRIECNIELPNAFNVFVEYRPLKYFAGREEFMSDASERTLPCS